MDFDEGDRADTSMVEDRRGARGGGGLGGLRGGPVAMGAGGLGVIGLIITLLVSFLGGGKGASVPGFDPGSLSSGLDSSQTSSAPVTPLGSSCTGATSAGNNAQFITCVLTNIQSFWTKAFQASGEQYTPTKLVLFTGGTQSGCGAASSDTGPFYCPLDQKVYIDLDFFKELESRFGGPNKDFSQAYVLAHEVGHHLQKILGTEGQVRDAQQRNPSQRNALSVRLELQADCYAGVWGKSAFEAGKVNDQEIDDALQAAAAVGDDRIQKAATGRVNPESFTHGSAKQRTTWFRTGFDSGDPNLCDTFSAGI